MWSSSSVVVFPISRPWRWWRTACSVRSLRSDPSCVTNNDLLSADNDSSGPMVIHWKRWNYWPNVTSWFREVLFVSLAVLRMLKCWRESLSTPCRIFILFITLKSWWLNGNSSKTKIWRAKIGTGSCLSSNKSRLTRRKKPESKKNSTLPSLQNNSPGRRISKWKQVSISSAKRKSMKEKWKWNRKNNNAKWDKTNKTNSKSNSKKIKKHNFKGKNKRKKKNNTKKTNSKEHNPPSMNSRINSCQSPSRKSSSDQINSTIKEDQNQFIHPKLMIIC